MSWTLGHVDAGPGQFSPQTPADGQGVTFVIGRDDPATQWPAFHPGPQNGLSGRQEVTYEILFDLPEGVSDQELVLHLYANKGPVPELRIAINDRIGTFQLRPHRDTRERIIEPMSPISGWAELRVPFRADWLLIEGNRLRLTTIDADRPDAVSEDRSPHPFFGDLFGSGFQYGAVALQASSAAPVPLETELRPLPLYVDTGEGLQELVDLIVATPNGSPGGHALLRLPGFETKLELPPCDFGQTRLRIAVPATDDTVEATVDLELSGQSIRTTHELEPCRRWTIHVLPHVHLDVGYTDVQGKVIELHTRNVDRALEILSDHPDYALSLDGSFVLRKYLESRVPSAGEAALQALRDGTISVQAFSTLFLTGVASLEECYRAAYYAAKVHAELDVPVEYANLTDVPSYSWATPSIVADLGLDSFMGIQNHARAGNRDSDAQHIMSPVNWRGPDGQQVMAYFADSYSGLRKIFSDPPTVSAGGDGLCRYLDRYERDDYLPTDLPVVGTHADNEDLAAGEADFVARWNARYAYPRLRNSTIADYFTAIRPLREALPVYEGDGGSYWEDGVGTAAAAMATYRRAQSLLPDAEAVLALMSTVTAANTPPRAQLDAAWDALLFGCEHTWTAYHAVAHAGSEEDGAQTAWKVNQIESAAQTARELADRGMSQLGEAISAEGPAVVVFNPSSWERELEVEVDVQPWQTISTVDGAPVVTHPVRDLGLRRVRLRVPGVPALGYRTLPLGVSSQFPPATAELTDALTTERYEITLDGGRVTGLLHRTTGQQLLDPASPYALGEVLYVSGGGTEHGRGLGAERSTISDHDWYLPAAELDVTAARMTLQEIRRSPWGLEIELVGTAPSIDELHVEIRLPDGPEPVQVHVRMNKAAVLAKESVYVAFPFAVDDPTMRYDRQQGFVDPSVDHQLGACNEWFTIQHTAAVSGPDLTVLWASADAPLFSVGDVVRGTWATEFAPRKGWLLSWVMNNYWYTNFPASQSGDVCFRYAFQPREAFDPVEAARFGREVRHPGVVSQARPLDKTDWSRGTLSADAGALLDADLPPNVVATVVGGQRANLVLRLQEVAGQTGQAMVRHPHGPDGVAFICTATEDRLHAVPVSEGAVWVEVPPHRVLTLSFDKP